MHWSLVASALVMLAEMQRTGPKGVRGFAIPAHLPPERSYRHSMRVFYYRALEQEPRVPFEAEILHQDAHLLVVDKPSGLLSVPGRGAGIGAAGLAECRSLPAVPFSGGKRVGPVGGTRAPGLIRSGWSL